MGLLKNNNEMVKEAGDESPKLTKSSKKTAPVVEGKSFFSWLYQPVVAIIVVMLLTLAAIEMLFVHELQETQQLKTNERVVAGLKSGLDAYLKQRIEAIESLAASGVLVGEGEHSLQERTLPLLQSAFSELQNMYVISSADMPNIRNKYPEMSFASVDLARKVAQNQSVQTEAFLNNNAWIYQIVVPLSSQDELGGGVVLAVFDVSEISVLIRLPNEFPAGQVSLHRGEGPNAKQVMKSGASGEPYAATMTEIGGWQLRYSPLSSSVLTIDRTSLWGFWGLATLLMLLCNYFIERQQLSRIRNDLLLAAQSLRQAVAGEGKKVRGIHSIEVNALVGATRRAFKESTKQNVLPVEHVAVAAKEVESAGDVPLFDDELLDLDMLADADDPLLDGDDAGQGLVSERPALDIEVPQEIFRAYDIRGVVDDSLNDSVVELIGRALASEALSQNQKTICVGYDGRLSSVGYCEALVRGIVSTGADAIIIGQVPTPVLYFATHQLETGSGVMITGSHNPSNYNGFKMMVAGHTLSGDEIQKLYSRIILQDFAQGQGSRREQSVDREYLDVILNDIAVAAPLKVVVDAGNGVAGELAPALIEELGCEVVPLYCDIDGTFPNHHPDPGKPENLQDLIAAVEQHNADIGLAFDGDGDRVGVVTNTGKIIWPDRLLMLFAKDVVSRNPGADVIFDVKCSRRLNGLISNYGGRPIMWKTGHSLIKAKMKETGALLAGEMSGHIFFKERWYGFDDGLYSAARLLEILGVEDRTSNDVFAAFPEDISTPEINITVTDESKFTIVAKLAELKANFVGGNASTIDGLRVDYPNGWGLCRASNTTPVLVLRFEADSEESLNEIKAEFKTQLLVAEPSLNVDF